MQTHWEMNAYTFLKCYHQLQSEFLQYCKCIAIPSCSPCSLDFFPTFKIDFAVGLNLVLFCYIIGIKIESDQSHYYLVTV